MTVPAIGAARGLFEIFIPGVFLIANITLATFFSPWADDETQRLIIKVSASPMLVLLVAVTFGYLAGVLLRLYRCELADDWSAWWLRHFDRGARLATRCTFRLYATESFPYIGWLSEVCREKFPDTAAAFYDTVWAPRLRKEGNRAYFNFCKGIVSSEDPHAAVEIYAAEALSRYLAGMLYALLPSFVLLLFTAVSRHATEQDIVFLLPLLVIMYVLAIIGVLQHYRFVRIKEVQLVFAMCYRNRKVF
jgi:hypothetical protein